MQSRRKCNHIASEALGRCALLTWSHRGVVETPLVASLGNPTEVHQMLVKNTALKRVAKPEEVTAVVLFLLSEQASYITATVGRLCTNSSYLKKLTS